MLAKKELTQQEKDKLEIDPNFDFKEIAKRDFNDISANEIGMFKWSGVYHQLQTGYFMMRLRMPGGILTSCQLRKAGSLAKQYAQNQLCITTRQCLQFHWLRKEDLYKVIEGMEETGIITTNACGDVVRNVTCCPGMGTCSHELADTKKMMFKIADDPQLLSIKRNLPRKHKITVAGCNRSCGCMLLNCQSWVPTTIKGKDGNNKSGWIYYAGGGLGRSPFMAKKIFDFVPENLVLPITQAGVEIHNRYGDRRQRIHARLKIIVDKYGCKGYSELILDLLRQDDIPGLENIVKAKDNKPNIGLDPFKGKGILPEKTDSLNTVRVRVTRSEMSSEEANQFADFADKYGNGEIMFTQRQNLQLRGVHDSNIDELKTLLRQANYSMDGLEHLPDVVSCVGTTVCNMAVADTPNAYRMILEDLTTDKKLCKLVGPLKINMNGCPNSCTHHWIADIGLRGLRTRLESGGSEEGFTIHIGGKLQDAGKIGIPLCDVSTPNLVSALKLLLNIYIENRMSEKETFSLFCERYTPFEIKTLMDTKVYIETKEIVSIQNQSLKSVFKKVVTEAQK